MLLSIGNVRSTTRVNFNWTGAWANAAEAVPMMPSARDRTTPLLAFIIVDLPLSPTVKHCAKRAGAQAERPGRVPGPSNLRRLAGGSEVHSAHSAAARHGRSCGSLLRHLGNHRLGGDEQARDRGGALQRLAHHLGRVDDALLHQ